MSQGSTLFILLEKTLQLLIYKKTKDKTRYAICEDILTRAEHDDDPFCTRWLGCDGSSLGI